MLQQITLVVVGLIALHDNDVIDLPEDLDELSAYELALRLRVGRKLPDRVLICVSSQEELLELMEGIEGLDTKLELMTDDRTKTAPANLDELMAFLPKDGGGDGGNATGGDDSLFNILQ